MKLNTQCSSCDGTGLYQGIAEAKDEAVICIDCNGTGCRQITYTPYTGRVISSVNKIRVSRGKFILNCGGVGKMMTYAEFEREFPTNQIENDNFEVIKNAFKEPFEANFNKIDKSIKLEQ